MGDANCGWLVVCCLEKIKIYLKKCTGWIENFAQNGPELNPRWNRRYLVLVCISVHDILSVPTGTERYH